MVIQDQAFFETRNIASDLRISQIAMPEESRDRRPMKVVAVVPAYNEEKQIGNTIAELKGASHIDSIIVIDDCSTDKTYEIATNAGVIVIRHDKNKGVGGAIKSGFLKALEIDVDMAVIMAGDGQMDPVELPKFLKQCRNRYGLVVGNRFAETDPRDYGMPTTRYYGAKILSLMTYIATGQHVPDSQNGYTALSRDALLKIDVPTIVDRWGVHNDIISRCAIAGIPITSVPQNPKYFDANGEKIGSKHWSLNIIYPNLKVFFKTLTRRLLNAVSVRR